MFCLGFLGLVKSFSYCSNQLETRPDSEIHILTRFSLNLAICTIYSLLFADSLFWLSIVVLYCFSVKVCDFFFLLFYFCVFVTVLWLSLRMNWSHFLWTTVYAYVLIILPVLVIAANFLLNTWFGFDYLSIVNVYYREKSLFCFIFYIFFLCILETFICESIGT